MERLRIFLLGILTLALTGCGQTVIETLNVPENPGPNAPGYGKTVVILPFADYSQGDAIDSAHRRNMMVTETLVDRLSANGFGLPIQEDVFQYLVNQNVIALMPYESIGSSSLSQEINSGDWSDTMTSILTHYNEQSFKNQNEAVSSPGTHGLTKQTVAKIGRQFDADYIVRGRILEYKTRQDTEWVPWKKGIIPFVNNSANRLAFGFASSDEYDETNNMLTGGILGGIIGHNVGSPWGEGDEILGISGGDTANAILWGSVGMFAGKQSYQNRVDQAAVQLRIWVQEAATGNVVYTNRIRVLVSPESVYADNQYDTLFNKAIEKGVTTLVDNFVIYTFL
ncbi:hypothetical protein [Desulfosediminicola ganghwensis]|uniref:hypothetical protein n=1 Tax=Desulfosediminicola ganghwensis TaxID=2569540 RepID=UPI0010AD02FA|nr:hypothetical protein [Desulfosediminicola ganghwensis]